jgi:hypothetical protein
MQRWSRRRSDNAISSLPSTIHANCEEARLGRGTAMRLDDCDLDGIDAVSTAPFQRNAPEEEWTNAAETNAIPKSLYDLYQRAHFLSFGAAPRFLSDDDSLLFSYFALVLRSVQESLVDAQEQLSSFASAHELVYDLIKHQRGEKWERGADKRARRHFRDLLISLQAALDANADIIAIFFAGAIKELEVGRAQFSKIERWLGVPLPTPSLIATPGEFYLKKLYDSIKTLVHAPHPETDWLPMMRLFRNKAAHLGQPLFRQVGLHRKGDGKIFVFIPRQWPYLWEKLIKPAGQRLDKVTPFPELLHETLIHQDITTYLKGLYTKVWAVIAASFVVLNEVYDQFKDLPTNPAALAQLNRSSKKYDFEGWTETR